MRRLTRCHLFIGTAALIALLVIVMLWPRGDVTPPPSSGIDVAGQSIDPPDLDAPDVDAPDPDKPGPLRESSGAIEADATTPAALPDAHAPLADIYDHLKRRASAGDTAAQCRLAFELNRCRMVDLAISAARAQSTNAAAATPGSDAESRYIEDASRLGELARRDARICGPQPPESPDHAWQYLLAAANAGHVPSMLRFAIEPPISETDFIPQMAAWQAYQTHAGRLLQNAADVGDPTAVFYMHWVLAGHPMPGGAQILPQDPAGSLAFALAAQPLATGAGAASLQRSIERLRGGLDHAQIDAAQTHADTLRTRMTAPASSFDFSQRQIADTPDECGT